MGIYSRTSSAMTRPSGPVPAIAIVDRSSPFSFAIVQARGDATTLPPGAGAAAGGGGVGAAGGGVGVGVGGGGDGAEAD